MTKLERDRALLVAAHPDDLETYAGAMLLALARAGYDLHLVIATSGERGTRQPKQGTRADEQRAVAASLGDALGSIAFWGFSDSALADERDALARRCCDCVEGLAPSVVLVPHAADPHADHSVLATCFEDAPIVWRWLGAQPISDVATHALPFASFEGKEALIRAHASQIPGDGESRAHLPRGLDILERARERDRTWGRRLGCAFAEPLAGTRGTRNERVLRERLGLVVLDDVATQRGQP